MSVRKTPRKPRQSDGAVLQECLSYVGTEVLVPSEVFPEENRQDPWKGKVVGVPGSAKKKPCVYVRFEEDESEYWFPLDDVKKWVTDSSNPQAAARGVRTPPAAADQTPQQPSSSAEPRDVPAGTPTEANEKAIQQLSRRQDRLRDGGIGSTPEGEHRRDVLPDGLQAPAVLTALKPTRIPFLEAAGLLAAVVFFSLFYRVYG